MTAAALEDSPRLALAPEPPDEAWIDVGAEAAISATAGLPASHRRALRFLVGVLLIAAFAYLGYTIAGSPAGKDLSNWVGDGVVFGGVVLSVWRAWAVRQERTSWLLVGAGLAAWLAGDCYWNVALKALASPPAPSWADLGYLLFYPLTATGLILQIRHAAGRFPHGFVLDWIIGGLAVVAAMAALVFPDALTLSGGNAAQVTTNLAYPVGDLVLLALLVGAAQLNSWRLGGVWAVFGLGLILWVAGDSVYLLQTAAGTYTNGAPVDTLWSFGALAIGIAAWRPVPTRLSQPERRSASGSLAVFALSAVVIVVWDHFNPLTGTAIAFAGLTLLAVVARLLWSLAINRSLAAERQREALTDDVTGLANHRALIQVLNAELERSRRYERPLGVLFIDLDHFKAVNDSFGHDAGDGTLAAFGEVVSAALRDIDTIARWGGEEFIALLPETDLSGATAVAERICERVAEHAFGPIGGAAVTCSIGVAAFPTHGAGYDELLSRADAAMYRAKRAGRNRVVAADAPADRGRAAKHNGADPVQERPNPRELAPASAQAPAQKRWRPAASAELDPLEFQFRLDSVPACVWVTVIAIVPALAYAAIGAQRDARVSLSALCAVILAGSVLALRLPWERILRLRWREAFFIGWWLIDFAAVIAATLLDGGPRSPLFLLVFVLLVFMGFSYARASVIFLTAVSVVGYGMLALAYGEEPTRALFIAGAFVGTGTMSFWQTRNQDRRRDALVESRRQLESALRRSESAKHALGDSERRLSDAQAIAHIGSWEWDVKRNLMTASTELLRIVGVNWEDFDPTVEGFLARVHPADRDEVASMLRRSIREEEPFSYEHRIVRPDDSVRLLLIHCDPVLEDGKLTRLRGICQDLTDMRAIQERLAHLADHDVLTGLFNRRRLVGELDRELSHGARPDRTGALLIIDVDGFGFYNDSYGQPAGDALLQAIAAALISRLGSSDVVSRCAGDEFVAVLPDASERVAIEIAGELRALVAGCPAVAPITVSVGISKFGESLELTGDDVLARADIALHEAKDGGGNRVAVYQGQPGADMTWVQRIRAALCEDRFVLYGQPIIHLGSDAESHVELLIRMLGDDGATIAPGAFLPAAERFGLINEIDRWVVATAIGLAKAGQRVAVNLSAYSIGDEQITQLAREAIADGLDPASLAFEITESAAVTNVAEAREFAAELTGLGCDLAIDDFGTGFASFTYLKHIPARYVKIDMEFIKDLASSATDKHVVASIVDVARSLGKRTIAEGVEDEPTLTAVRELGVDFAQGFYTGRPVRLSPPTEFERSSAVSDRERAPAQPPRQP